MAHQASLLNWCRICQEQGIKLAIQFRVITLLYFCNSNFKKNTPPLKVICFFFLLELKRKEGCQENILLKVGTAFHFIFISGLLIQERYQPNRFKTHLGGVEILYKENHDQPQSFWVLMQECGDIEKTVGNTKEKGQIL